MKQRLHPDDLEFYLKSNEKRLYRLAYSYMRSEERRVGKECRYRW